MSDQQSQAQQLQRERDFLLGVLQRIAASDPSHSQFVPLVRQEAREAVEFVEEGLI